MAEGEVSTYAFFQGTLVKEVGKLKLPKTIPVIYVGKLSRLGRSNTLDFDGYVLEGVAIADIVSKKVSEKLIKDFDDLFEGTGSGEIPKSENNDDILADVYVSVTHTIFNQIKKDGKKVKARLDISDIDMSRYHEYSHAEHILSFFESDFDNYEEYEKHLKRKEEKKTDGKEEE